MFRRRGGRGEGGGDVADIGIGLARRGMARSGAAGQGEARIFETTKLGLAMPGLAWLGEARPGWVR